MVTKFQSVSIPEFMARGFPPSDNPFVAHMRKHGHIYIRVSGAIIATMLIADVSYATSTVTPIDIKAHKIYSRLCMIGKWIIVIRGGVDIISSMSQGELDSMKKKVITYIVGYLALLGLPWILDQASALFDDPSMNITS